MSSIYGQAIAYKNLMNEQIPLFSNEIISLYSDLKTPTFNGVYPIQKKSTINSIEQFCNFEKVEDLFRNMTTPFLFCQLILLNVLLLYLIFLKNFLIQ